MKTFPNEYTRREWLENHYVGKGDIVSIRRRDGSGGQRVKVTGATFDTFTGCSTITTSKGIVIEEDGTSEYFIAKIIRKAQ